jgi:SAM-dependent methyltransferase
METFSPSVVLAAYAETLLDGRRVAVFGDAMSSLADELLERGARVVHLYDPDAARAAEAAIRNRSKQISVLPLDTADIAVRDGAFDVAIIADLSAISAPAQLLKRVRRALSPRGAAIVATPNPDAKLALMPRTAGGRATAISYYDLFDAVSAEFSEVRMLGQTPFVGYAVVDFSPEGSPEVSLDSGLVPGGAEEPEWFIAVASASPVELDAFSIVQLPMAHVARGAVDPRISDEARAARANEARLVEQVAALRVEMAERVAAAADLVPDGSHELRALEAKLSERDLRISELQAKIAAADTTASVAHGELEALRETQKRAALLEVAHADLEKRNALHQEERERLEKRLFTEHAAEKERLERRIAEHVAEKERLEKRLRERDQDVERLVSASAGEGPDDVARLEAALKDRGERTRQLESDLREAERIGKELVRELTHRNADSAARHGGGEAAPSPLLSGENARLRADLEAAGWTIQELEGRLSPVPASPR